MRLVVDVTKQVGDFTLSADFTLSRQRCGIFGPSGSGKSTLMHILAGLLRPDSGRITLDGKVLFDHDHKIHLPPQKRRIGVVFQHALLFPHMNVRRNLLYGWRRTPMEQRSITPEAIIEVLNLEPLLERRPTSLSGGERQRVALGRTVLSCPRLLLMDEPLTGLDQLLKFQIIPYLRKVLDEFHIPLLFISHSLQEIRLMTDEVLVFDRGGVQQSVPTEELARRYLVSDHRGYANLLHLENPRPHGDLFRYNWGGTELILTEPGGEGDNLFELGARDITLFKQNPVATSARNLLSCRVTDVFGDGNRIGVELTVNGGQLISQIVPESLQELDIAPGSEIVAVIKASAFRKLY
ncbi:molybdate-transporting ATPase [Desulfolithobacter dissulfuricans]|uniref:Molybdate-transporting ATPase n=1 Tax=Desulfolithobacter dissulfuricans TaxID=2795293 RepID=A0A915U341_9BACT|nr:molybdenum ABC transporter ATP-binding protein [Desulfolithobacter dissulfuricans]BCO10484.1 molybdate-transporting ATPase [Desulfolithobacter dissulfuricans]